MVVHDRIQHARDVLLPQIHAQQFGGVLDFLAEKPIDLIVSDVRTSGESYELVKEIRSDPATADIPLVYLTSQTSLEDEFEAYLSGADAFITKPFRARDLLATIDDVLNRTETAMSQEHCFLATELALRAQAGATIIT